MPKPSEEVESDEEVLANMHHAIDEVSQDKNNRLYFGILCITGDDGYVTFMRSMKACNGRHMREAAGLLLGYANKLAEMADKLEGDETVVVPRYEPDPNAS